MVMGHLSVAAHDYLLTGERGRWAAGRGQEAVGAGRLSHRPGDLWQVSATCSPDRSSGLEFIWVTATGVVCCDKRLMGRAPGAAWGAASAGHLARGGESGCSPCTAPRPSLPELPLPSAWAVSSATARPPKPFIPGPQRSRCGPSCPPTAAWRDGPQDISPVVLEAAASAGLRGESSFLQHPARAHSYLIFMHQNETIA